MYKKLYEELLSKKARWQNEEEVRLDWISALSKYLEITFDAERGRKDSSYNNVIIEFKDRGLFNGSDKSPKFLEARDLRLKKYIIRTAKKEGIPESNYIGIGIDGEHIFFAQVVDGKILSGPLLPFSEISVGMVATACKDAYRRAVTAGNLIEDFGLGSIIGTSVMKELASRISERIQSQDHSKEKMLFEEWQTLYGQIADLATEQESKIEQALGFKTNVNKRLKIPASLFVIHTYNSFLIKVLAAEIVSSHGLTSYPYFSQFSLAQDDDTLLESIKINIEDGKLFSRANINGFVEEAIFSWYLDACQDPSFKSIFVNSLRNVFTKIALYRTDNLDVARSKDVLKQLYQNLVPELLRKSLGEFYTPDWLVDVTLDKVEPSNWVGIRTLDPTCGSGSFLLEIIRRKREAAKSQKISDIDTLQDLTKNVWGFDLNPLAVQTARVNFLIAISDLLKSLPGHEIELPILLADAIYSPARNPDSNEEVVRYRIGSQIADLEIIIPFELAFDRNRLDQVFSFMEINVEQNNNFSAVEKDLLSSSAVSAEEFERWKGHLGETYNRVLALHKKNWNGIWFRIVRNFFWSATAGRFDIVAGNPPWVRWSKLPALYRERAKPTCMQYDIFSSTPHHGGNELDISAMITYTVADKWLKSEGDLAFVITQTLFQTPSSEGFRRFNLNADYSLIPIQVDDLKDLKPFKGIANRTSIAVFKKTAKREVPYPIPYKIWSNAASFTKIIPENLSKSEVLHRTTSTEYEANPAGGNGSPWAILKPGRFEKLNILQGRCNWVQGRKGITADLNGIYFVEILETNKTNNRVKIATRPEAGKIDLGPRQNFWIEPDLLYPLLKGSSDFGACRLTRNHNLFAIVPNLGISQEQYKTAADKLRYQYPQTAKYFEAYKPQLNNRSTFRLRMKGAPFFAVYNVGDYTFSPWKVIWAEQGSFRAAVISSSDVPLVGPRVFVPDHKIFFADFQEPDEAYFLCGLLNATAVKEYIESHNISIQIGDIFKHMSLPTFDKKNKQHLKLSLLTKNTHECAEAQYSESIESVRDLAEKILGTHQ